MPEQSNNSLKDLNIVVTGAGRGLGAALALALSDSGSNVILCGRSQEAMNGTAGQIENRTGHKLATYIVDLADPSSIETAAKQIIEKYHTVDVLINNGAAWLEFRETPYEAAEVLSVVNSAISGTFLYDRFASDNEQFDASRYTTGLFAVLQQ